MSLNVAGMAPIMISVNDVTGNNRPPLAKKLHHCGVSHNTSSDFERRSSLSTSPVFVKTGLQSPQNLNSDPLARGRPPLVKDSDLGERVKKQSLDDLFGALKDDSKTEKVWGIFKKSRNSLGKSEISDFAKIYRQTRLLFTESKKPTASLDALAGKYASLIIKDSLGEKSGFGPWSSDHTRVRNSRNNLEHELAVMLETHLNANGQSISHLFDSFINREVEPFILEYVENQLNDTVQDCHIRSNPIELVEKSVMVAYVQQIARDCEHFEQSGGPTIGRLSRALMTAENLPCSLRKIKTNDNTGVESQGTNQNAPTTTQVPAGGNTHITNTLPNITNTLPNITNTLPNITNTLPEIHVHVHLSDYIKDGIKSPLAENLNLRHMEKMADPITRTFVPKDGGYASYTYDSPDMGSIGVNSLSQNEWPNATQTAPYAQSKLDGDQQRFMQLQNSISAQLQMNVPVGTEPQIDSANLLKTGGSDSNFSVQFGNGSQLTLPPISWLHSAQFQVDNNAELEFLTQVRRALEPLSTQPLFQREEFERIRNNVLPHWRADQTAVLNQFADQKNNRELNFSAQNLCAMLSVHSGLERQRSHLTSVVKLMNRHTNFASSPQNPLTKQILAALNIELLGKNNGVGTPPSLKNEATFSMPAESSGKNLTEMPTDASSVKSVATKNHPKVNTNNGVILTTDGLHFQLDTRRQNTKGLGVPTPQKDEARFSIPAESSGKNLTEMPTDASSVKSVATKNHPKVNTNNGVILTTDGLHFQLDTRRQNTKGLGVPTPQKDEATSSIPAG